MTLKSFTLWNTIIGAAASVGVGLVTYFSPEYATAINSSIVIMSTALIQALQEFIKQDNETR